MTPRGLPLGSGLLTVLSIPSAPSVRANTPISVDVERAVDKACTVDATFDVNAPASIAGEVPFYHVCGKRFTVLQAAWELSATDARRAEGGDHVRSHSGNDR